MRRVWEQARARIRRRAGAREREAVGEEPVTPEVEALLTAVRRSAPGPGEADADAGARAALAAFREARDSGVHAGPGRWWQARRRDDWRPSGRWRGALPVRAAFASAAVTVTLGGVALAAGTGVIPAPFGTREGGSGADATSSSAPATPGAARASDTAGERLPSAGATGPGSAPPLRARDEVAHCVAHLVSHGRSAPGRGAPSKRLTTAADDAGLTVKAYCESVLTADERRRGPATGGKGSTKAPKSSRAPEPGTAPGRPGRPAKPDDGATTAPPADPADPSKTSGKGAEEAGNGGRSAGRERHPGNGDGASRTQ
ncbi:hypothetical protein [Streptomyces sp. NPDC055287]